MDEVVCTKCGQIAQFKCERCLEPYCSAQCQEIDWQYHKANCYKFPNLLPLNIVKAVSNNFHSDRNGGTSKRHGSTHSLNEVRHSGNLLNNSKTKPRILLNDNNFILMPKSTSITPFSKPLCDKPTTWRIPFQPSEGFFDAMIQFKEEVESDIRIVWVTDLKYEPSLRKLLAEINRTISRQCPCSEEDVYKGALVAAPLDNMLYRAEVLETSPDTQKATVRLIDYGNEILVPFSQLFAPIPIMSNLNSYAFRVCLPNDYGPVEIESIITLKILGEKQPENYYNIECKMKAVNLSLPIELFNKEPLLKLVKCFSDNRNALLRLCDEGGINDQELDNLLNSPQSFSFEFESVPKNGAFIAGRTQYGWKRARLLGFSEKQQQFLIYAIDEGFISFATQIKKIPDDFIAQPIRVFAISSSVADCMLSEAMLTTAKRLTINLLPTSSATIKDSKTHLPCSLFDENRRIIDVVMASVFTGSISELGIKLWHENITEGETVIVSHVLSFKEIYIASQQNIQYSEILMSEYSKCIPFANGETIEKTDIVMYCKKDVDSKCFRGQVTKCECNQFKVIDIDSGSENLISRQDLRKPNLLVYSLPVRCVRVTLMFLENIPTIPVANNKALEALEACMQNAVEFDVTFSENKAVDLLFRTKEKQSLCKKLLPMVFEPAEKVKPTPLISTLAERISFPLSPPNTPIACQAVKSTKQSSNIYEVNAMAVKDKLFTIEDIEIIPIVCGEKVPLYVLDSSTITSSKAPFITAADYNNKEFLEKIEHYLKAVADYCKSDKALKNGYAPKKKEICLAIFKDDGEWYRAICLDQKPNDIFVVMFLDYGNISKVNKKDIMPIILDLMFPSNANTVYLEGITNKEQVVTFLKSIEKSPIILANIRRLDEEDAYAAKILN